MLNIALLDLPRLRGAIAGDVVPARVWTDLAQGLPLLDQARQILSESEATAEQRYRQAREEGIEAGRRMFSAAVLTLDRQLAEQRAQQAQQAVELALAIVRRIAPQLGANGLVVELARAAVESAQARRFTRVRVHPGQVAAVEQALHADPESRQRSGLSIVGDPSMGEFDCSVDTDLSLVVAGLDDQLQVIERALLEDQP